MSIVKLEMSDITFVDLPVQAIMVYVVEEPQLLPQPQPLSLPHPEEEHQTTYEDICCCVILTPLVIAMIPMGIMGITGTVVLATPFLLAYMPIYIYNKCKN
jgi:hypothetical protein